MCLKPRLAAERMTSVYETLERPLVPVIVGMERAGIKVDRDILSRLSGTFAQRAVRLEERSTNCRPQVQSRVAQATRRTAVRPLAVARRQEDQDRTVGDARRHPRRSRRQRGTARGRPHAHQYHAGMAPAHQAALDLHRRAARHSSIPRRAASTPATRSPRPRRAASPRPIRTCRTSPCAPRKAAKSAPPSSPTRARRSSPPTIRRSNCAYSPTSPTFRN